MRNKPIATHQAALTLKRLGKLWLAWNESGLVSLRFGDSGVEAFEDVRLRKHAPAEFSKPLRALDAGKKPDLGEIRVDLGGTIFQQEVWNALRKIPIGAVRTYAGVAADIKRPRATRAVGMANGANALPVVIPCHRVISAGSALGGYSGGLKRKRLLLELEGVEFDGDLVLPGQLALF
ncbi:MAG: O-6-methylguanine DNA methyltransferase [Polyangiales bacterium]